MKRYLFTVYLEGRGENVDRAYKDACRLPNLCEALRPSPLNRIFFTERDADDANLGQGRLIRLMDDNRKEPTP